MVGAGFEGGQRTGPVRLQTVQADRGERRVSDAAEDGVEGGRGAGQKQRGHHRAYTRRHQNGSERSLRLACLVDR